MVITTNGPGGSAAVVKEKWTGSWGLGRVSGLRVSSAVTEELLSCVLSTLMVWVVVWPLVQMDRAHTRGNPAK